MAHGSESPGVPGSTRSVRACSIPFGNVVAWISTQWVRATGGGVSGKLADRAPAGTVISDGMGTTTSPSMLPMIRTSIPPAGAGDVRVTVAVPVPPPVIAVGDSVMEEIAEGGAGLPAGRSASQFSGDRYPSKAVPYSSTTRVGTETADVAIGNEALVAPSGTRTVAGGRANVVSLLTMVTWTPPGGAAPSSVTVPVTVFPPITRSAERSPPQRLCHSPMELCCQDRPKAARSVPIVAPDTGEVVIGATTASVLPAGIVTVPAGTSTPGRSLATLTLVPPAGAGMFSAMRAAVGFPPDTLPGSARIQNSSRPGGVAGEAATVNAWPDDQGPNTLPWVARTRQ